MATWGLALSIIGLILTIGDVAYAAYLYSHYYLSLRTTFAIWATYIPQPVAGVTFIWLARRAGRDAR